ncbi:hypothetical protein HDU85_003266 [Gaertneriomyces sp. JEL0708]|nr:hypothetical protein HDU85_003266 [Gaertneriomyces sp. JEL0708]
MPSSVEDAFRHLHLVEAMRTNDVQAITTHLINFPLQASSLPPLTAAGPSPSQQLLPSYGSPLHLLISLCNASVIQSVLAHPEVQPRLPVWINARNSDGETPLHVAARLGRTDIVEALFAVPGVDDTLPDNDGRTIDRVAKGERLAFLILTHRMHFAEKITRQIRTHLSTPSYQLIIDLFNADPRANAYLARGWFDINAPIDTEAEMSILHFAAKADDIVLVNWCLAKGADPGVKDRKGKKPVDLTPKKDSKTKERLRTAIAQAPIMSGSLPEATSSVTPGTLLVQQDAPTLRGQLFKWTNYAIGYKSRYFVLEHGNLSYYKTATDYPLACRGSISTMIANVVLPDSSDKSRFDVVGKGSVRYALKARSPADAKKWVWALMESKKFMVDRAKRSSVAPTSTGSSILLIEEHTNTVKDGDEDAEIDVEEEWDAEELSKKAPLDDSYAESLAVPTLTEADARSAHSTNSAASMVSQASFPSPSTHVVNARTPADVPSLAQDFQTLRFTLTVQMDVQQRLVNSLVTALQHQQEEQVPDDVDFANISSALASSSQHIQQTIGRIIERAEKRDRYWMKRWRREKEGRKTLEDIIQRILSSEAATLSKSGGPGSDEATSGGESAGASLTVPVTMSETASFSSVTDDDFDSDSEDEADVFYDALEQNSNGGTLRRDHTRREPSSRKGTAFVENVFGFEPLDDVAPEQQLIEKEAAQLARELSVISSRHSSFAHRPTSSQQVLLHAPGYPALTELRTALPLDPTSPKPVLSIWGFLKSAIGKDLSKVTLPVFFNEPLSMLQRMCEDVEYVDLLSVASVVGKYGSPVVSPESTSDPVARDALKNLAVPFDVLSRLTGEESSLIRLMYVGAYAMSNYSSTVNRVQKPFNPLLGETYELVRPDKQYRYLSEQVCHHPPISACYCDSPDYAFWTEVNVKSKFWGKSLEICPAGLCHVVLPVWGDSTANKSDDATGSGDQQQRPSQHSVGDERYEHYTWKKVTTTVNNLIMGTLYIEHSGDMVIRNHRTNEECTLTFKPNSSGWMGSGGKKGKNLIVGTVKDRNGVVRWNIEGRWDEGLTATRVGTATGQAPSTLALWRRAPLPPNPEKNFHFTYFANSLNQGTPILNRLLPRTDSRLRPDQKAMERGEWQRADEYKEKVEKAQRERRRLIVEEYERTGKPSGPVHSFDTQGVIPIGEDWWTPRWFVREIETDTGEPHWRFTGEYWKSREKLLKASVGSDGLVLKDGDSAEAKWPEWVLDIFQV